MFTSQKGLFPFVSKITGLIIFVYPTFMVIAYSVRELFIDFTAENIFLRFSGCHPRSILPALDKSVFVEYVPQNKIN